MRKIEHEMITAVANGRDWQSSNTCVGNTDHGLVIRLHGNKIAQIDHENQIMWVTDAGWQTNTTKSRLNALLSAMGNRAGIYQKDFVWYLTRGLDATEAETIEMERGQTYAVSL